MPFGFRLSRTSGQGENFGGQQEYAVNPANTTAIFNGDPVSISGGYVELATGANASNIQGIFNGCQYVGPDGSYEFKPYWNGVAGSSDVKAAVVEAEGSRFLIEMDAAQGAATQAMIGTARILVMTAGNTTYGDSRVSLGAVGADGPVRIVALADLPGNVIGKVGAVFEVVIANRENFA